IGSRSARKFTGDYLATLDYRDFLGLTGSFSFGGQAYWDTESLNLATGRGFAGSGVTTVGGAAVTFGGEEFSEEINLGAFVQNRFEFGDLFLTGAVRIDGNSAFGENYGFQVYPKADVAYNLGPGTLGFSSAKLRAAVGMAGKAPGAYAKFQTYQPNTVLEDQPGVSPDNPGNQDLEPENKLEWEVGADLGLWNDRIGIDATFWNAVTQNALLRINLPPSEGFSSGQLQNVGELLNRGFELSVNAGIIDQSAFRWNTGINYEWNKNEILDLGETAVLDSLPIYEGSEVVRWEHHYRLGGFWEGLPSQEIITRGIVGWDAEAREHIRSDYGFYQGREFPDHMASLNNDFTFGGNLRLAVQLRGEWGASMANSDRSYGVRQLAYDEYLRHLDANGERTPAADSVLNYMRLVTPVDSRNHVRLQEVSLSYVLPDWLTGRMGLDRSTLTLAGYNLMWWDHCNCPDPNQQYRGGDSFNTSPFLGVPQPRRFLLSFRTRW
ncbi:MAG TPA: TonB-dependent receptor, partial [Longimicrobiales bacterium]|nr:TonB-dependent receptor [Longimicrobiales bacterium]